MTRRICTPTFACRLLMSAHRPLPWTNKPATTAFHPAIRSMATVAATATAATTPTLSDNKTQINMRPPTTPPPATPLNSIDKPTTADLLHERSSDSYLMPHPLWPGEYIDNVRIVHRQPKSLLDWSAHLTIQLIRFNFDWMSGWSFQQRHPSVKHALNRIVFLETVAGVPGSIAAVIRHLASLRRMQRDGGWIHTLLEEAENERMHLLTALQLKQPSYAFKAAVFVTQGIFFNFFFAAYLVSPRFCHRLVGYLEEEAVKTYTHMLETIERGDLAEWKTTPAPLIAKDYWKLKDDATMHDVIKVIRADESHHRDVNHTFADLKRGDLNPYTATNYTASKPASK